jgi:putative membrane protein
MVTALLRWLVLTVAVWIAAVIVPHIEYDDWRSLLIAALVLGVLNTVVRPILRLISLPFIILSFGLFLLVINALLLKLTAWLVPGFHVAGFWPAVGASVVISIVSMFLGYSGGPRRRIVVNDVNAPPSDRTAPPGKGPIIDV